MKTKLTYVAGRGLDPYENLALEEYLLHHCGEGERILYLWQNERTVVIGRNQNVEKECAPAFLWREGVRLARRRSGGGAVYHDRGNLNYTFIAPKKLYDAVKQMEVVLTALRGLGIPAECSGRNDILAGGRKVSGNAFFESGGFCCHHGTLMVDVDLEAVNRYLLPDQEKLASKGVASIRARVANLREFQPLLEEGELRRRLRRAFEEIFGGQSEERLFSEADRGDLECRRKMFADYRWIYGDSYRYSRVLSHRFLWGGLTLYVYLDGCVIRAVQVDTDAMEPELPERLREGLSGTLFENRALYKAVLKLDGKYRDIAEWLLKEPLGG